MQCLASPKHATSVVNMLPLFLDFHLCGSSASVFLEAPNLLSAGAAFVLGSHSDRHAEHPLNSS